MRRCRTLFRRYIESLLRDLGFRKMNSYEITVLLVIILQCMIPAVLGQLKVIKKQFVNETNILTRIPFTTITSCFMQCSHNKECSTVGFGTYPYHVYVYPYQCYQLKEVEDYGLEEKEGLVQMFVMITEEKKNVEKPPIPDCPVDGGYGDWSAYTLCSTTCGNGLENRNRQCNNPFPKGTGLNCSVLGNATESRNCNVMTCLINIAKRKPANQISTYYGTAGKGNDGLLNTHSYTTKISRPWWTLDLGAIKEIRYMVLNPYSATNSFHNIDMFVDTRQMSEDWVLCKDIGSVEMKPTKIICVNKTVARYIRVQARGYCYLTLREFEVYVDP